MPLLLVASSCFLLLVAFSDAPVPGSDALVTSSNALVPGIGSALLSSLSSTRL